MSRITRRVFTAGAAATGAMIHSRPQPNVVEKPRSIVDADAISDDLSAI